MITIAKTFRFEAAHILPHHEGHCSRLHGHSWELEVGVTGPVNPVSGFVVDFAVLKDVVNTEIVHPLDHQFLGAGDCVYTFGNFTSPVQVPSILPVNFYPTSENLVELFARILGSRLAYQTREPGQAAIMLTHIKLKETCTSEAIWTPR